MLWFDITKMLIALLRKCCVNYYKFSAYFRSLLHSTSDVIRVLGARRQKHL